MREFSAAIASPFDEYRDRVRREWIDENHHMNMGYYVVAFDLATDAWLGYLGLTSQHRSAHAITTFTLESHVNYLRELREDDPLRFTTLLLGFDAKRIHYIHEMWHAEKGYLGATNELMSLHVSQTTRRAAAMAPEITERLARVLEAHQAAPRPDQVGRRIGLAS